MPESMVLVDREDLARVIEKARRPGLSGMTPGEKGAMDRLASALEAPEPEPEPEAPEPEVEPVETGRTLESVLPELAERLVEAGFENLNDVRVATDEELLAVDGIGPARLRKVRSAVGED